MNKSLKLSLRILLAIVFYATFPSPPVQAFDEGRTIPFPPNFWWGTSLAAHQSEGGNLNTWSEWEDAGHTEGKSGLADDHWNRYEEDFDLLVNPLHVNTHRLSIEWSRLEPHQGEWKLDVVEHYREMIKALRRRNIRPVICLFHFSLPIWVGDAGAFENPKMIDAYVHFVSKAEQAFGDLVQDWLTMNEPNVYALGGYAGGGTPPGVNDYKRAANVFANLMKANGRAYQVLKKQNPHCTVSFAHHMRAFAAKDKTSPIDRWGVRIANNFFNWSWLEVIKTGKISLSVPTMVNIKDTCDECKGALDYLGINYYSRDIVELKLFSQEKIRLSVPPGAPTNSVGWEIYPEGLGEILQQIKERDFGNYPILITENGIPDCTDLQRPDFIYEHLKVFLQTTQRLGLTAMGYLHWSNIDNFEWLKGTKPCFGLIGIDYATEKRQIRHSADYFGQMGEQKKLFSPQEARFISRGQYE